MATINFYRTTSGKLDLLERENGRLIFVEDTKKIYLDSESERTEYSQIITLNNEEQRLGLYRPVETFYFVKSTNSLWRYEKPTWIQLTTPPDKQVHFLEELPDIGVEEKIYVLDDKMFQWKSGAYVELGQPSWNSF